MPVPHAGIYDDRRYRHAAPGPAVRRRTTSGGGASSAVAAPALAPLSAPPALAPVRATANGRAAGARAQTVDEISRLRSFREMAGVVLAAGLRPCAGAASRATWQLSLRTTPRTLTTWMLRWRRLSCGRRTRMRRSGSGG